MNKRIVIGIVLVIIAVICFVLAAMLPGEGETIGSAAAGVCTFPFIWIALRGNKKEDK